MKETFKQHPVYSSYSIGDKGTVNGIKHNNIGSTKTDGYRYVWINGTWKYIHRLVYETFVGTIDASHEINHKDGNRSNNCIDNLECLSHSDNIKHSYEVLGRKLPKGKDHWNYGRIVSNDTKQLMSAKKQGELHPKFKGWYVVNGIEYATPHEPAKLYNISTQTVFRRCKAGRNGYSFRAKEG